jgi:murein DD-endopeptidase MepM/ murein hydrolase activator NlpD
MFSNTPSELTTNQINDNSEAIDSLLSKTKSTQLYLNDLQKILNDEPFDDSISSNEEDSSFVNYQPQFYKSTEDSLLRYKIEHQNEASADVDYEFFFAPVKGIVSQSFQPKKAHYGIDIVTKKEEPIKSCLEGTVIIAGWTPSEGEVIIIQHNNDLISVYKHCHSLLKKQGDKVQTADPIAIVGNSGKYSSGPHLHFEIWKKGIALNPEEFISFKK